MTIPCISRGCVPVVRSARNNLFPKPSSWFPSSSDRRAASPPCSESLCLRSKSVSPDRRVASPYLSPLVTLWDPQSVEVTIAVPHCGCSVPVPVPVPVPVAQSCSPLSEYQSTLRALLRYTRRLPSSSPSDRVPPFRDQVGIATIGTAVEKAVDKAIGQLDLKKADSGKAVTAKSAGREWLVLRVCIGKVSYLFLGSGDGFSTLSS